MLVAKFDTLAACIGGAPGCEGAQHVVARDCATNVVLTRNGATGVFC